VKSSSWVILECLVVLAILGVLSFFTEPKYGIGVGMVLTAIIAVLNNTVGTVSGGKMPEQAGDAKPGQSSTVTTESTVSVPAVTEPVAEPLPAPPATPPRRW
jgi:hypothetical protein